MSYRYDMTEIKLCSASLYTHTQNLTILVE